MAKFLLLLALGIVVYLIVSRMRNDGQRPQAKAPPAPARPEDMVRCAVCKVHLPRSESFVSRGEFYCSDEHLKLARGAGRD
jgi:uncharacterized protein